MIALIRGLAGVLLLTFCLPGASAQSLYKYRDENGQWQFSDRPPSEPDRAGEVFREELARGDLDPTLTLERRQTDNGVELLATNTYACPVQLVLELKDMRNVSAGTPQRLDIVVAASGQSRVMLIEPRDRDQEFSYRVAYTFLAGDTAAVHEAPGPYRVPFAVGKTHTVTQAFPSQATHADPGSYHAIDVALPVGTAIYAARQGTVIEVAYDSFSGGTDAADVRKANVVRVGHDDGTLAVYAHLAWNSIRVRPGQRVERGEYLADSGNTGFSSGPHLHFAVQRNVGLSLVSEPVSFLGPSGVSVVPVSGQALTAY